MRRITLLFLVLMTVALPAQIMTPSPQTISVQDSGTACSLAGSCATWQALVAPTLTFQVVGTFSATLTIEASSDRITFFAVNGLNVGSGASTTTITAPGQYAVTNVGFERVRLRATTLASGGANVLLNGGYASSASGSSTEFVQVASANPADTPLTFYTPSAASTNSNNIKASPGNVYGLSCINTNATLYYLRLYNLAAAPTCSSSTGFVESLPCPASATGAGFVRPHPAGQGFSTGIGYCLTGGGGSTDNTNAATGVYVTVLYK